MLETRKKGIYTVSSKDISLGLVEHLDLLKQNGTDYLLVTVEPGKNADRADVWYELKDKDSPANVVEACLSLFANIYEKEDLINMLLEYCEFLDNDGEDPNQLTDEEIAFLQQKEMKEQMRRDEKREKKRKSPP